jgi:hypothetical protein
MTEYYRDWSPEKKWKDGKGQIVLSQIEYYNVQWIDLRIMNTQRPQGQNQHTRHGVRMTLEQAEALIPALEQAILKGKEEREKSDRKSD